MSLHPPAQQNNCGNSHSYVRAIILMMEVITVSKKAPILYCYGKVYIWHFWWDCKHQRFSVLNDQCSKFGQTFRQTFFSSHLVVIRSLNWFYVCMFSRPKLCPKRASSCTSSNSEVQKAPWLYEKRHNIVVIFCWIVFFYLKM